MKVDHVYDFCLDWQMNSFEEERQELKEEFKWKGWDFDEFKEIASKNRWFVDSMNSLKLSLTEVNKWT